MVRACALLGVGLCVGACSDRKPLPSAGLALEIDPSPALEIGAVDGQPAYLLDGVNSVFPLDDGTIVVASGTSNTVSLFDGEGVFLGEFGSEGDGPGELRHLMGAWSTPDGRIGIYDGTHRRVSVFEPDGTLVREVVLRPESGSPDGFVAPLPGGGWALSSIDRSLVPLAPQPTADPSPILHFGPDGEDRGELERLDGYLRWRGESGSGVLPFTTRVRGTVAGRWLALGDGGAPDVLLVDPTSGERRTLSWEQGSLEPEARDWQALRERLAAMSGPLAGINARLIDALPGGVPLPHYAALLSDSHARIWVKRYDPTRDDLWTGGAPWGAGGAWMVFDTTGAHLTTVTMPDELIPLHLDEDRVLGVRRDELGVEYVRAHPWRSPPSRAFPDS